MFKPFKPPLLKKIENSVSVDLTVSDSELEIQHRPYKKRKLLIHEVEQKPTNIPPVASQAASASRKPLLLVANPSETKEPVLSPKSSEGYYMVLW